MTAWTNLTFVILVIAVIVVILVIVVIAVIQSDIKSQLISDKVTYWAVLDS